MQTPVTLIGMPACGKTALGKLLAKQLGYLWIDTDDAIESQTGQSVIQLYSNKGEAFFRKTEAKVLKQIMRHYPSDIVLSTGGGTPTIPGMLDALLIYGKVVYLKIDVHTWLQRVWGSEKLNSSPRYGGFSRGELTQFFHQDIASRAPFYSRAHHILEVSEAEVADTTLRRLLELLA